MIRKLSLAGILSEHLKAFTPAEKIGFFGFPIVVGFALEMSEIRLNQTILGILTTALSIFCALLFGLLIPIIDQAQKLADDLKKHNERIVVEDDHSSESHLRGIDIGNHLNLSKQLFANVAFTIFLSLAAVVMCVVLAIYDMPSDAPKLATVSALKVKSFHIIAAVTYSLSMIFVVNIWMLLRRFYFCFRANFD